MLKKIDAVLNEKGRDVWSLSPAATVHDAIQLMIDKRVEALLVLDHGKLVGIITERDCARKVSLRGKRPADTQVSEVMTSPVVYVTPKHSVGDCMSVTTEKRIDHLPVLDGETLVGIVSTGDLVMSIINERDTTIGHLEAYITGKYTG